MSNWNELNTEANDGVMTQPPGANLPPTHPLSENVSFNSHGLGNYGISAESPGGANDIVNSGIAPDGKFPINTSPSPEPQEALALNSCAYDELPIAKV